MFVYVIQAAARISVEHATVNLAGLAQCVAQEEEESGIETAGLLGIPDDAGGNSAAVLDGGVDDIGPLQLWDTIMKKYKVAQVCTQELERLRRSGDESDQTTLLKERAVAVSVVVEALSKLHHKDVHAKLQELVAQERRQGETPDTIAGHCLLESPRSALLVFVFRSFVSAR